MIRLAAGLLLAGPMMLLLLVREKGHSCISSD
jgi:hypothetical protein